MIKKRFMVLISFVVMTAFSACFEDEKEDSSRTFWASNIATNADYQLDASLVYDGAKCQIYVENANSAKVSTVQATAIGQEYDNKIHSLINNDFGIESDVDSNGKIILLILDIKDGFTGSGGYVAGYFNPYDLYDYTKSNNADMIYIDCYPLTVASTDFYEVIAHEFQHMVNYNIHGLPDGNEQDIWLNEGLSSAAEYLYKGAHVQDKIDYFNTSVEMAAGQNFVSWGSWGDTYSYYCSVYVFFQWLRIQSGTALVYKDIINSSYTDYQAVVGAVTSRFTGYTGTNWSNIIGDWYLANMLNEDSGFHGYKNEITLTPIKLSDLTGVNAKFPGESTFLSPGEGFYWDYTIPNYSPAANSSLEYIGIDTTTTPATLDYISPYAGNLLLVYHNSGDSSTAFAITSGLPATILESNMNSELLLAKSIIESNKPHRMDVVFSLNSERTKSIDINREKGSAKKCAK